MSEAGVDDFTQLLIRFLFASIPLTPFMVAGYKAGEFSRASTRLTLNQR